MKSSSMRNQLNKSNTPKKEDTPKKPAPNPGRIPIENYKHFHSDEDEPPGAVEEGHLTGRSSQ